MNFVTPNRFTTRPEIEGTFGVVTSTHWIATAVGMGILERGGNAFDAACATAFTLQVVEPHLNGPGGDVPVILYDVRRGKPEVICGQGSVPAGATIAHYRDTLGLDLVPGTGLLAACIPGTFDTWMMLLRDYGTMRIADVLSPAIGYARNGYPLVERICATIDTVKDLFKRALADLRRASICRTARCRAPGTHFTNPTMADTYERILQARPPTAATARPRSSARARPGARASSPRRSTSSAAPRRSWTPRAGAIAACSPPTTWRNGRRPWRRRSPTTTAATRCSRPARGRRGRCTLQQLALSSASISTASIRPGPTSSIWQVECAKLAFADREAFYGDPKFVDVPMETLLSDAYNAERRKLVDGSGLARNAPRQDRRLRQTMGLRLADGARAAVGSTGAGEPTVGAIPWTHDEDDLPDAVAVQAKKREKMGAVPGDTVHFDIVDKDGNMVSATPSGGWLHSSPVIPELGFPLGTRAQMFWLEEGHPASLAPGKRPRSTLTPDAWRCATASRTSPGARPAATSRTSGSRSSSCATSMPA